MTLLRNSIWALLPAIVPTLLSLVTLPLFIGTIGAERYGILAIAWVLLGYFGAADFGIGRAITQRLSSMAGAKSTGGDRTEMATAVWSALASMAGFGLIGAALVWFAARWYFSGNFSAGPALRRETVESLWALAICCPVMAINGVLAGSLMGLARFRMTAIATGLSNIALLLFPLAAALLGRDAILDLILASLAARLLGMALLAGGVWLAVLRAQRARFVWAEFRRLANFGAWITLTALVGPLMVSADRLLIGAVAGAAAVAAYTIPFHIASRTLIFPVALTQALFPRFAADSEAVSARQCRDFVVFVGLCFAPVMIALIVLAPALLPLWLGASLDPRSVPVAQLVLAAFWVNAIAQVPYGFLQARGNPRFTGLLHLGELPVYLALLMALGGRFGLTGFAAAFGLRCLLDCIVLCRASAALDREVVRRLAAPAALLAAALLAGVMIESWLLLLGVAAALCSLACAVFVWQVPPVIRARLEDLPIMRSPLLRWVWLHAGAERAPPG